MHRRRAHPLRDAARALVGALLVGTPLAFTMETWWLGWTLPAWLVLAYGLGGMALIAFLVHHVGFREGEREEWTWKEHLVDGLQLVATAFVASLGMLALIGVVDRETT